MCLCVVWLTATLEQASPGEVDAVYQVLKQAGEISTARSLSMRAGPAELPPARRVQQPPLSLRGASSLTVGPTPHASSSGLTLLTLLFQFFTLFYCTFLVNQTIASSCTRTSNKNLFNKKCYFLTTYILTKLVYISFLHCKMWTF